MYPHYAPALPVLTQAICSEDKMFNSVISVVFSTETHIFLPDMPKTRFLYIILFMTQRHTLII